MRKIIFIRHGKTQGNIERRYIGRTDQPLAPIGIAEIKSRHYPDADTVISSPMKRCTETAGLIFGDREIKIYDDLRECDFGNFEYKNHEELKHDPNYIKWISSSGREHLSGGESMQDCIKRSRAAFLKATEENAGVLAFVVHGGTIMGLLSTFTGDDRELYHWHCENGCGYTCDFDEQNKVFCNIRPLFESQKEF